MTILDTTKCEYIKNINKEIVNNIDKQKRQRTINEILKSKLKQEMYRNIQKTKQDKINNELKKLRFNKLANKNNISQDDLVKIKQLNDLSLKTLQKIAHQRNIDSTDRKKENLIYMLIRSEVSHKENNYIKYLNKDTNNEIHNEINKIRMQLVNVSSYLKKQYLNQIRKRLYEIEKKTKINRTEKTKLLKKLSEMSTNLKFKRKNMVGKRL